MIVGNSINYNRTYALTPEQRATTMYKTNNQCVYCGRNLSRRPISFTSREHIIPLAVIKWTVPADTEEYEKVWELINSPVNCLIVCRKCNEKKGSSLPSEKTLRAITRHFSRNKDTRDLWELYDKLKPYIAKYEELFSKLAHKQNNTCRCCEELINPRYAAIRRLEPKGNRCEENARIICDTCCDLKSWRDIVLKKESLNDNRLE